MRTCLKKGRKTRKNAVLIYSTFKIFYVGKVTKLFFKNLTQKSINFEAFLVEKVPKNSNFNRDCLENRDLLNLKNQQNQKWVK